MGIISPSPSPILRHLACASACSGATDMARVGESPSASKLASTIPALIQPSTFDLRQQVAFDLRFRPEFGPSWGLGVVFHPPFGRAPPRTHPFLRGFPSLPPHWIWGPSRFPGLFQPPRHIFLPTKRVCAGILCPDDRKLSPEKGEISQEWVLGKIENEGMSKIFVQTPYHGKYFEALKSVRIENNPNVKMGCKNLLHFEMLFQPVFSGGQASLPSLESDSMWPWSVGPLLSDGIIKCVAKLTWARPIERINPNHGS